MSTRRYAAHRHKAKTDKIRFVDRHGNTKHFSGKMTFADLLKAGVTHIAIKKPSAPLAENEFREDSP